MSTFTGRLIETVTIEGVGDGAIHMSNGWSTGAFPEVHDRLPVGTVVDVERDGSGRVTGYRVGTTWLCRMPDEELEAERQRIVGAADRRRRKMLDANRDDWTVRTAALPDPLRERIEKFRRDGGDRFEVEGWGYELTVCELAVLYAQSDGADSPAVLAYAEKHGTSGSQHDAAKVFARKMVDEMPHAPAAESGRDLERRARAYADSLASQDIQVVLQQSVHGASVAGYIAGHRDAVREPEADRLRKMFRLLHGVEPTRAHHPVGAYLPVGQMDGDCSCGRGPWPCDTLRGETRG